MDLFKVFLMSKFTIALIVAVVIFVAIIAFLLVEVKKLSKKENDHNDE